MVLQTNDNALQLSIRELRVAPSEAHSVRRHHLGIQTCLFAVT